MEGDAVNHPAHYKEYPMEVKEIIRAVLGEDGYKAYTVGNELKYRLRAGFKTGSYVEDMEKAMFYRRERL